MDENLTAGPITISSTMMARTFTIILHRVDLPAC